MIPYIRHHYPEAPADVLRLVDGKLVLKDGSDPTDYLKAWANEAGVSSDTPINVMRRDEHIQMRDTSMMMQLWGA